MGVQGADDEPDLEPNELDELNEFWTSVLGPATLEDALHSERLVWSAAGENGGLTFRFDPEAFWLILEHVRLPGRIASAGRNGKIEVTVSKNVLRMRSQSSYITCEAEIPLKKPLSDLADESFSFLVSPLRFEPFFTSTSTRWQGGEIRQVKKRDRRPGFDVFEYVPDEGVLVLSSKGSHFALPVEAADRSDPLQKLDPDSAMPLPSIKAFEKALRCVGYANVKGGSRERPPEAVFRDGQCIAAVPSRAAIAVAKDLEGLSLTVPLNMPLKVAAKLQRLRDPARIAIFDDLAIIDDGHMRCAFAASPGGIPLLSRDQLMGNSANSTWTAHLSDLQNLWAALSTISKEKSKIVLTIKQEQTTVTLETEIVEIEDKGWTKTILDSSSSPASDAPLYRSAQLTFRDLAKAIETLTAGRITIAINEAAVVLAEQAEDFRREYVIARSDVN